MKIIRKLKSESGRAINVYEKERWAKNSKAEKWGVKPRKKVENKFLLIQGTGRSGTKFSSNLFKKIGLDIGHEKVGEHGTSTHFFHSDSDWYPYFPWMKGCAHVGERLSDYYFEHSSHIVRNPLITIPSIQDIFGGIDFEFLEDNDMLEQGIKTKRLLCMHVYYNINKKLEDQTDYVFQLEKYRESWPVLQTILGLEDVPMPELPPANKGTGYRKSEATTWDELSSLDPILTKNLKKMSRRYGYEV